MSETVRLVLYVPTELKTKLETMAKDARPKTSTTRFGEYILELGLSIYDGQVQHRDKNGSWGKR